ncbi:MAG TPA: hypothetical protein DCO71_03225 [Gammaproteobacteria bacterium]|nr:hypothetical protein [Gammaproteobacteria bacterium]
MLNINLKTVALQDVRVDLAAFNPPEAPVLEAGPFPGVLASLEHGLSYSLQEVNIDAVVQLSDQQSLTANITGGGVKPDARGAINLSLLFNTGNADDHIDVNGEIALDQLSRGRFAVVETALDVAATLAALPQSERGSVKLRLTPAQPDAGQQHASPVTDNGEEPPFIPEALHLALQLDDSQGNSRSLLKLDGIYNGNSGGFDGGYEVTANEQLVQPYIKDTVVPPAEELLTGELAFNIADLTGNMTVISDLLVTEIREVHANQKLPELLRLKNNFRLSLLPGKQLRVETLDTGMRDEAENQPLASTLPADLDIPLDNIDAFLQQEQTLLEFALPGVPLSWFDVLLPDHEITDGNLTAAFRITTDTQAAIHLIPVKPLEVKGLTVRQQDAALIEGLNLSVLPAVSYSGDVLNVSLDDLVVDAGKGTLASANVTATLPLSEEQQGTIRAAARADLNAHRLVDFLGIEHTGKQTMPEHFALDFDAALQQGPGAITVNALDASLSREKQHKLLQLQLLQPLVIETTETSTQLGQATGKLATLTLSDIQLKWFTAFVPDTWLSGKLQRADFTLSSDARGIASITAARPVAITGIYMSGNEGPLLTNLGVRLRPEVRLGQDGTQIIYKDLRVTGNNTRLVSGDGKLTLPGAADKPLLAEGRLDVDVQAMSRQPLLATALQAEIEAPVRFEADYQLAQGESSIDISHLAANLFYADPEPRLSLQADSKLRVLTRPGRRQSQLDRARGKVTLTVANLTPEPFANILAENGLAFTAANGKVVLASNGKTTTVDTLEPFTVTGVAVQSEGEAMLHPFTLTADIATTQQGDTLQAKLNQLGITFDPDQDMQALAAHADLTFKGRGDAARMESLDAGMTVRLPAMLDQPAILPGHTLKAGELMTTLSVDAAGKIDSLTRVQGLQGREELPLQLFEVSVDGQLDVDGGFALTAPVRTRGASGDSDLTVRATHTQQDDSNNDVDVVIDSTVFYLNDILNTLDSIAGKQPAAKSGEDDAAETEAQAAATGVPPPLSQQPDAQAFWDVTGYDWHVTFDLERLFYTDYLEITGIKGRTEDTAGKLLLSDFEAHFHDSPITADGVINFVPGEVPYDLKLEAAIEQFDVARFFRELAPEHTPRAEGLFNIKLDAFGQSPNMPQYRNKLFFDMRLQSRDGVFRPFNPDSALVAGSSGFAGGFGEVVSYVPTGLFGLGAVSRLVYYIKEIEYDKIDIHMVRDESRDVQIRKYVIQSPEILMLAKGGIEYQEGIDILHSPLSLKVQLDMRDRGAAILYSLNLLQDEQDPYGYWKGPEINAWGTAFNTESNLEEIISTAGKGAVLGGFTRPVSGLIGDIKHLWFSDGEPIEHNE